MTLYSTQIEVETEAVSVELLEVNLWDFITEAESKEEAAVKFLAHAKEFLFPDQYDMSSIVRDSYTFWVGDVSYQYTIYEPSETTKEEFKDQMYDQCSV